MILLKKLLAPILFPLPFCLAMVLLGVVLLWWSKRRRAGTILVAAGSVMLLLLSYAPVANMILAPLENRYHGFGDQDSVLAARLGVRAVVVLGGGHVSDPELPYSGQLGSVSVVRLVEGIRIYRMMAGGKLILSGGAIFDPAPNAEAMRLVALELGVPDSDIALQPEPQDTYEEVRSLRDRLGNSPFVIVTSASHMPRAMALLEKAGMHPIPAPTNQLVKQSRQFETSYVFPEALSLLKVETALHEYYGLIWGRLLGDL